MCVSDRLIRTMIALFCFNKSLAFYYKQSLSESSLKVNIPRFCDLIGGELIPLIGLHIRFCPIFRDPNVVPFVFFLISFDFSTSFPPFSSFEDCCFVFEGGLDSLEARSEF